MKEVLFAVHKGKLVMNVEKADNQTSSLYEAASAYVSAVMKISWVDGIKNWIMNLGHDDVQTSPHNHTTASDIVNVINLNLPHSEARSPYQDLMMGALVSLDQSLLTSPMVSIFTTAFNDYLKFDPATLISMKESAPDSIEIAPPDFMNLTFKELFDVLLNEGGADADIYAQEGKDGSVISSELTLAQLASLEVYEDHSYAVHAGVTSDANTLNTSASNGGAVTSEGSTVTPVTPTTVTTTPTSSAPPTPITPTFFMGGSVSEGGIPGIGSGNGSAVVIGVLPDPPKSGDPVTALSFSSGFGAFAAGSVILTPANYRVSLDEYNIFKQFYIDNGLNSALYLAEHNSPQINDPAWKITDAFGNTLVVNYYTGQYIYTLNQGYDQNAYGSVVQFNYTITDPDGHLHYGIIAFDVVDDKPNEQAISILVGDGSEGNIPVPSSVIPGSEANFISGAKIFVTGGIQENIQQNYLIAALNPDYNGTPISLNTVFGANGPNPDGLIVSAALGSIGQYTVTDGENPVSTLVNTTSNIPTTLITNHVITQADVDLFNLIDSPYTEYTSWLTSNSVGHKAIILTDSAKSIVDINGSGKLSSVILAGNELFIDRETSQFVFVLNHGYDNNGGYAQLNFTFNIGDGAGNQVSSNLVFQIADTTPQVSDDHFNFYSSLNTFSSQPVTGNIWNSVGEGAFSFGLDGFKSVQVLTDSQYAAYLENPSSLSSFGNFYGLVNGLLTTNNGVMSVPGDYGTLTVSFYNPSNANSKFGDFSYQLTSENIQVNYHETFHVIYTDGDGSQSIQKVEFDLKPAIEATVINFNDINNIKTDLSLISPDSSNQTLQTISQFAISNTNPIGWLDNQAVLTTHAAITQGVIFLNTNLFGPVTTISIENIQFGSTLGFNSNLAALASFDVDNDGSLTKSELANSNLFVWFDNGDGIFANGMELVANLSFLINSIDLNSLTSGPGTSNGNFTFGQTTFDSNQDNYYGFGGGGTLTNVGLSLNPAVTPVILDLGGHGISLVSAQNSHVTVGALNSSNDASHIGWFGPENGVLVYDPNHTGKVTSLGQISFMGYTPGAKTDLEGLQAFDTNHNSMLDSGDAAYNAFQVWQDANGNGIVDTNEMLSLAQRNIANISLVSDHNVQVFSGNTISGMASYQTTDGKTHAVADVSFGVIPAREVVSTAHNNVDLSPLGNAPSAPAASAPTHVAAENHSIVEVHHSLSANFATAIDHAITSIEQVVNIQAHH